MRTSYFAALATLRERFSPEEIATAVRVLQALSEADKQAGQNLTASSLASRLASFEADFAAAERAIASARSKGKPQPK